MNLRFRFAALSLFAPVIALVAIGACATKINDHAPPAPDPVHFIDVLDLDGLNHFPEADVETHDAADSDAEVETDAALEADAAEADLDVTDEADTAPDADDAAEVDDTFDATPVIDECGPPLSTSAADAGSCTATVQSWADEGHTHYAPGTIIDYCTKPPNSGPHYYVWASYRSYDRPIPYGYLVHDLEHGAVDVYYQCSGSCPTLAAELQAIIDARPVDPLCDPDAGVSRRVILSPDPTLPTLVAAAAWGWTYTADCVDSATLGAFIDAHYAMAAEDFCTDGIVPP